MFEAQKDWKSLKSGEGRHMLKICLTFVVNLLITSLFSNAAFAEKALFFACNVVENSDIDVDGINGGVRKEETGLKIKKIKLFSNSEGDKRLEGFTFEECGFEKLTSAIVCKHTEENFKDVENLPFDRAKENRFSDISTDGSYSYFVSTETLWKKKSTDTSYRGSRIITSGEGICEKADPTPLF